MKLTEKEKEIINRYRTAQAERKMEKERQVHRLVVAAEYAKWLLENGSGTSYSTFCDEFGYEVVEGESRKLLYERVTGLFASAE